jgi:D-alanyl-lipoteichoic acid acyltransferase DltB (MBOAT superfamily)
MLITVIVFFIAGIWHGPSWNYVLFGVFHGFGLVVNHVYNKYLGVKLPKYISWFLTFNFINISFIFFRTKDIDNIITILKKMIDTNSVNYNNFILDGISMNFINNYNLIICFLLAFFLCICFKNSYDLINKR